MAKKKKKTLTPENLASVLSIQDTPDRPRKTAAKYRGQKTGLGLLKFWQTLFSGNELLASDMKMTNGELERQAKVEFAHVAHFLRNLEGVRVSCQYYRYLHNRGKMVKPHGPPKLLSFRYNNKGEIVETRRGLRIMTNREIVEYMLVFKTPEEVRQELVSREWLDILEPHLQDIGEGV